ncbi:hypothetical protein FPY71_06690 [Aureimonas fodinaquatilis]|uniref:Uncharacterized protein n=1 Tax=Aureimonas fodinaquatilis TaxID=2565783 RepID=A0A5B0DTX9_9HYPH|nr:hypothetical protein [Aureimonas fodinaquatilis]KAA0970214.1 hypothetical protein FPY71_06690 [Aureimonas fodinaquatilis]
MKAAILAFQPDGVFTQYGSKRQITRFYQLQLRILPETIILLPKQFRTGNKADNEAADLKSGSLNP